MRMSSQGQFNSGLPDVWVMEPPGCYHELDRLRQVAHLLLGIHCPIGPHAKVGVAADEADLSVALAVLKLYCGGKEKEVQN